MVLLHGCFISISGLRRPNLTLYLICFPSSVVPLQYNGTLIFAGPQSKHSWVIFHLLPLPHPHYSSSFPLILHLRSHLILLFLSRMGKGRNISDKELWRGVACLKTDAQGGPSTASWGRVVVADEQVEEDHAVPWRSWLGTWILSLTQSRVTGKKTNKQQQKNAELGISILSALKGR